MIGKVDPAFDPTHAAHAKLILLTAEDQGRLLIGSGNLGLSGYASGGELFTQYEYSENASDDLSAFRVVRSLLDELVHRGYLRGIVERHLELLLEGTPWLSSSATPEARSVRHNLHAPFIAQLGLRLLPGDRNTLLFQKVHHIDV